jgi:hypothetical protein
MAIKATALITLTRVNDGKGIKSTSVTYQIWSNGTSTPTGTWSSTPPKTTADKPYLWTRTVITYSDNTQSTSYSVGSTPEGIQVGGRNLLMQYIRAGGMTTKINDLSIKVGTGLADTYFYLKAHQKLIKGETYTISCDASNVPSGCNWSFGVTAQNATWQLHINKNGRCYATGTPNTDTILPGTEFSIDDLNGRPSTAANIILSNFKLEKGNKATDWTPAPEDVEQDTNDKIAASEKTIEQRYQSAIDVTKKDITATITNVKKELENGVATSIQDISNKFSITSEGFSSIQTTIVGLDSAINGVKADPSAGKEAQPGLKEIMKYISWDGDDLTLGNTSQPFKCKISSSELAFYENLEKVAWISNKELYILTAIIAKSIGCGNFQFIDEGDLGFSLK